MSNVSQARPDGRPQYYDIAHPDRVQCYHCLLNSNFAQYGRGEAVINDPGNSPADDGGIYTICVNHLPDNAVIHDPYENKTRDKAGQNVWVEQDATIGLMPPSFGEGGMA